MKEKEITVKFEEKIAAVVEFEAEQFGITVSEMLRYVIGGWVRYKTAGQTSSTLLGIIPQVPFPVDQNAIGMASKMAKYAELMMTDQIKSGCFKCRNCTLPLTQEDLDNDKCHACGSPIFSNPDGKKEE